MVGTAEEYIRQRIVPTRVLEVVIDVHIGRDISSGSTFLSFY